MLLALISSLAKTFKYLSRLFAPSITPSLSHIIPLILIAAKAGKFTGSKKTRQRKTGGPVVPWYRGTVVPWYRGGGKIKVPPIIKLGRCSVIEESGPCRV